MKNRTGPKQSTTTAGPTLYGRFRCPACEGDQFSVVREMESTDHGGTTPDGEQYRRVVRHAVTCDRCDQHSVLIRYEA